MRFNLEFWACVVLANIWAANGRMPFFYFFSGLAAIVFFAGVYFDLRGK